MAHIITLLLTDFSNIMSVQEIKINNMCMVNNVHNCIAVCAYNIWINFQDIGNFVITMWITFDWTLKNGGFLCMEKKSCHIVGAAWKCLMY